MKACASLRGRVLLFALALLATAAPLTAQKFSKQDMDRSRKMLAQMRSDLRRYYYDSTFGGVDINRNYHVADSAIQKAPNMSYAMGVIAQYLADLKDSHTFFIPPGRVADVDYGFSTLVVGDSVFVERTKKGSDAEAKGVKPGDVIVALIR